MMKRNRRKKLAQTIFFLIASIIIASTTIFLVGCMQYARASYSIAKIEKEARSSGYYVGDGKGGSVWQSGWTEEYIEKYNQAVEEKEELIESSSIAEWMAMSAGTLVGQIVRFMAILISSLICLVTLMMTICLIAEDVKYFFRHSCKNNRRTR